MSLSMMSSISRQVEMFRIRGKQKKELSNLEGLVGGIDYHAN